MATILPTSLTIWLFYRSKKYSYCVYSRSASEWNGYKSSLFVYTAYRHFIL